MEDGDESALKHWRNWREMSIEKYKQEYEGLNVAFDIYSGESQVRSLFDTILTADH